MGGLTVIARVVEPAGSDSQSVCGTLLKVTIWHPATRTSVASGIIRRGRNIGASFASQAEWAKDGVPIRRASVRTPRDLLPKAEQVIGPSGRRRR